MKWLPYVWAHLGQNWIRTASTIAAIGVSIFLFGTLETFVASLHGSVSQGPARLITGNNISRFYSLPVAYEQRIAVVPGVVRVEGLLLGFCGASAGLLSSRLLMDALPHVPLIGEVARRFPRMSIPPASCPCAVAGSAAMAQRVAQKRRGLR
jgi:hypothetical protein